MPDRDAGERGDPFVLIVEAGYVMKFLAAGGEERGARLLVDLFERLEAIGGEARAHHVDALEALARQCGQRRLGVRL